MPAQDTDSTSGSTNESTSRQYQSDGRPIEDRVVEMLQGAPLAIKEISKNLGQIRTSGYLKLVLKKLREDGRIEYTIPDKPGSRMQKYQLINRLNLPDVESLPHCIF